MQFSDKQKRSCSNCRRIKRKCNGDSPCSSCVRKRALCDYNTTDRRLQRYSVGYIKTLETNNDVLEGTLAEIVALRDDPVELAAKLDSLTVSIPKKVKSPEESSSYLDVNEELEFYESDSSQKPFVSEHDQYFGAGSVYLSSGAPTQEPEPLLTCKVNNSSVISHIITLEDNFDYVAGLVRDYFNYQFHGTLHTLFDKRRVLLELENRNLSGPFLNAELVYAICANSESLTYGEAEAYCDFVSKMLLSDTLIPSIAISQSYTLLALHCASKGQVTKAWLFAGIGIRVGVDVGFDMAHGQSSCPIANRCFMGTLILDQYFSMSLGRRSTIQQDSIPVLRLDCESDFDFLSTKYALEVVELTRCMIRSTYQPVKFNKDPKINYLLKFNRSKLFNMKLLKWKQSLDPLCSWSYASLKASKNLASENHSLKFIYYYIIIFLNKPFLHVPKQHSTVFLFEEMSREVYLIVYSKLLKIEEQTGIRMHGRDIEDMDPHKVSNKFCSPCIDICVVLLLAKVLLTLITSQPEHYINLEKHFKTYVRYINYVNMRKYDDVGRPLMKLSKKFEDFKAQRNTETVYSDEKSSENEDSQIKEEHASCESDKSSPPISESNSCDSRIAKVAFFEKNMILKSPALNHLKAYMPQRGQLVNSIVSSPSQELSGFDHWSQHLRHPGWKLSGGSSSFESLASLHYKTRSQLHSSPYQVSHEQRTQSWNAPCNQNVESLTGENFNAPQGLSTQAFYGGTESFQVGVFSYDHLPKASDPIDQELNQLFCNNLDDYWMKNEIVDLDSLFRDQSCIHSNSMQNY